MTAQHSSSWARFCDGIGLQSLSQLVTSRPNLVFADEAAMNAVSARTRPNTCRRGYDVVELARAGAKEAVGLEYASSAVSATANTLTDLIYRPHGHKIVRCNLK